MIKNRYSHKMKDYESRQATCGQRKKHVTDFLTTHHKFAAVRWYYIKRNRFAAARLAERRSPTNSDLLPYPSRSSSSSTVAVVATKERAKEEDRENLKAPPYVVRESGRGKRGSHQLSRTLGNIILRPLRSLSLSLSLSLSHLSITVGYACAATVWEPTSPARANCARTRGVPVPLRERRGRWARRASSIAARHHRFRRDGRRDAARRSAAEVAVSAD
ncbi:hypothetical protein GW17_00018814 [Ensete ventricosum]|nr:hypothetical protein GW17_00018814 [Ensete ventricosum]